MLINNLFLGVGAMKSGTTWHYGVLALNPDIHFTYEKEIHYFAHCHTNQIKLNGPARLTRVKQIINSIDPKRSAVPAIRRKLIWYSEYLDDPINDAWYVNLFRMRGNQRYCADFSNLYCHLDRDGWDHVKSMTENLKVIYLIRDPIARLWSHIRFHLHVTGRFNELTTWSEADYHKFARQPFIWSNGEYASTVTRLRENLTESQLRIAFFEDIHLNKKGWLHSLENFLGLQHLDYPDDLLNRRINELPPAVMPHFFRDLFADYAKEELARLEELGLVAGGRY